MRIGTREIGAGHPVFIVAEIGINHNGDVDTALELIRAAADAGADAVKFQVGDPREYVRISEWSKPRDTPWGTMPYIEYRERMELGRGLLDCIYSAEDLDVVPFYSPLNTSAVNATTMTPCFKVASPMLTDFELLDAIAETNKPVILSSGMTTPDQLEAAVKRFDWHNVAVLHCTSEYPCPPEHANLRRITELQKLYPGRPVGFSDHAVGIPQSVAAVALGASIIERHLTLSRAMWGSDHAASLEPGGFAKMVQYIRTVEASMGDGVKVVYEGENKNAKFRRVATVEPTLVGSTQTETTSTA